MEKYLNRSGDSGVTHFQIEAEKIIVQYVGGRKYSYSYRKAGSHHVDRMKVLAIGGKGLSTYISQHIRKLYD